MNQRAAGSGQRAAGSGRTDRAWRGWVVVLFVTAALLAPIFAHGCHGGDEDHEPLVTPRVEEK